MARNGCHTAMSGILLLAACATDASADDIMAAKAAPAATTKGGAFSAAPDRVVPPFPPGRLIGVGKSRKSVAFLARSARLHLCT